MLYRWEKVMAEHKYILLIVSEGFPEIPMVGTKQDILQYVQKSSIPFDEEPTEKAISYYGNRWNTYPIGTNSDNMEITPWYEDRNRGDENFGFYIIGPIP